MKVGIFGGCFNPVHNMHKDIAKSLIRKGYLNKVIFVPTGDTYDKKDLVRHKNRVDMLNLIVDNVDIFVSDISKNEEYGYTYQVMDYYKKLYPQADLYFICGTDNITWFDKWKRYEYILENYKLLVITRNNDDIEEIMPKYEQFRNKIKVANIEPNPISSTMIREYIKAGKYDELESIMDEKVIQYVKEAGLYK